MYKLLCVLLKLVEHKYDNAVEASEWFDGSDGEEEVMRSIKFYGAARAALRDLKEYRKYQLTRKMAINLIQVDGHFYRNKL